jgi:hypothetical protein
MQSLAYSGVRTSPANAASDSNLIRIAASATTTPVGKALGLGGGLRGMQGAGPAPLTGPATAAAAALAGAGADSRAPSPAADQTLVQELQQFSREALLRLSMPSDLLMAAMAQTRLAGGGAAGAARKSRASGRSPSAGSGAPGAAAISRIPEEGLPAMG